MAMKTIKVESTDFTEKCCEIIRKGATVILRPVDDIMQPTLHKTFATKTSAVKWVQEATGFTHVNTLLSLGFRSCN